ncbi:O-antigen ligase family protein [Stieleria magnilauensis]|uniref:O-antigen ligase family protein n=1 Tax=Stieleria magnilauensis TaxID=2527963 RepID=UPI0011A3EEE7
MNASDRIGASSQAVVEALLLGMVLCSPWPFGSAGASAEFFLFCELACALLVFSVWLMFGARPGWRAGWSGRLILVGMLGLAAVAGLHLIPLPDWAVDQLAPGVSTWTADHGSAASLAGQRSITTDAASPWFSGSKLGLNAGGSFQFLIRCLAAACLFGMVCCFHSPERSLRRLSIAAVMVATALAIFGIAQHFGSHDGLAYWTYEIPGGLGFGPFVNRNHFPFFMNLGLGLTLGLLMERLEKMGRHWHRLLLADGIATWLLVALVFIIASLIVCVSRGGVLSAVVAITVVLLLRMSVGGVKRWLVLGVAVAAATTLLLAWVGFDFYESRLNMLGESDRYSGDGRWILWKAALSSVPEFPWFGSGGETYRYWETIQMTGDPQWTSETNKSIRADNEFLDVLNEYGIVGLLSLVLMAGVVVYQIAIGARRSALSAGACIGLLAVLAHSLVDFGLRVPATGMFAVIVAALLCSQRVGSRERRRQSQPAKDRPMAAVANAFARLGLTVTALTVIGFTFFALYTKRRYHLAERFSIAAAERMDQSMPKQSLENMVSAAKLTPEDITRQLQVAKASQLAMDRLDSPASKKVLVDLINEHSIIAMKLCPLAWEPSVWLANYGRHQKNNRERLDDLRWARTLHPGDPNLAFLTGQLALNESGLSEAVEHWNESLTYSTKYLHDVLSLVETKLGPDEIIERLLPADPVVTLAAALYFDRKPDSDVRDQCAKRTLQLLATPSATKRRLDEGTLYEMQSRCYGMLGKPEESIHSLRLALNHDPTKVAWRIQLARRLMESRQLDAAIREVRIVLTLDPNAREGLELQKQLSVLRASSNPSR